MSKKRDIIIHIAAVVVYLIAAVIWEMAIARTVAWWGGQLIMLRPHLTPHQSMGYAAIAIIFVLVVIPQFLWFPVTFFKELKWLYETADWDTTLI